jgi:F-type H+-transporting ATPase subunit b
MDKQMVEARRENQRLLEQARQAAEKFRQEERAKAQDEARAFIEKAREDIQRERDSAIEEVRKHFADLAIMAAEKVVQRSLDRKAHRDLIEEVLKEGDKLSHK